MVLPMSVIAQAGSQLLIMAAKCKSSLPPYINSHMVEVNPLQDTEQVNGLNQTASPQPG